MNPDSAGKTCRVLLRSEIVRGGDDTELFESALEGTYRYTPGNIGIIYAEYEIGDAVRNRVTVSGGAVLVERGEALRLEITPGQKREGLYRMPFGVLEMSYTGRAVEYELDENGGVLKFSYALEIGGVRSENRVRIDVETVRGPHR